MEIAFLVPRLDKPSTKFRVRCYLSLLRGAGVQARVFPLSKRHLGRWLVFFSLARYDLVVIQKKLFSPWELRVIRRRARRLVYDFDDAVMYSQGEQVDRENPPERTRFARMVQSCDWTMAGNVYLKDQARRFAERVSVQPTPVDTDYYVPGSRDPGNSRVTIGWLGSSSTVSYLKPMTQVFSALTARCAQVQLKIVSDSVQDIKEFQNRHKPWKEEEELQDLHSFDIGIMPLPDDPWTRGKCGFKLLQYQAVGLPVVCSPVGVNREIISDGVHGYYASTPQEWVEKLSCLVQSPELRRRMGHFGRERAVKHYSLGALWPEFFTTLQRVANAERAHHRGEGG
jgi:glycosyltransferase involved in cell wall biosynthesis